MLVPNRITWAKCPECGVEVNSMDDVPLRALGNRDYVFTVCPAKRCGLKIAIRVDVAFVVERVSIREFVDLPTQSESEGAE